MVGSHAIWGVAVMRSRIALFSTTVALVLASAIVVPRASAQPGAVRADPSGTVTLVENTVPSTVRLDNGTRAGLVYTTDREVGGRLQQWVRPFGQDAVRLPSRSAGPLCLARDLHPGQGSHPSTPA